jgi:hypothetical protein
MFQYLKATDNRGANAVIFFVSSSEGLRAFAFWYHARPFR